MAKRGIKKNWPFIYACIVSVATCLAAGVSTFAWFQATASVNITATSTSTTITVNKPEDFTFLAYKGNTMSTWTPKGTFANDFVAVTPATMDAQTSFGSFAPGQIFVYCVKITQASSLSIKISKIISNDRSKQGLTDPRLTYDGAHEVNVGWAIDMFEYEEATNHDVVPGTNYLDLVGQLEADSDFPDRFNFSESTNRTVLEAEGDGSAPDKVISLSSDIVIYDNSNSSYNYAKSTSALNSAKDLYVFFSIVYSDASTTWYTEVKGASDPTPVIVARTGDTRYFKYDTTGGNSNCYAGLKFALSQVDVLIG